MAESKKKASSKKSLPIRFTAEEKHRLDGVLGKRGHKYQSLVEGFLRWYEETGRIPWVDQSLEIDSAAESRVLDLVEVVRVARGRKPTETEVIIEAMNVLEATIKSESTHGTSFAKPKATFYLAAPADMHEEVAAFRQRMLDFAARAFDEGVEGFVPRIEPDPDPESKAVNYIANPSASKKKKTAGPDTTDK